MTPTNLLIVILLTWGSATLIDWVLALTAPTRVILVLALFIVYALWVFGLPLVVKVG